MTGFWLYLLLSNMLIPCLMIVFGIVFHRKVPNQINIWYGYRTVRSMKNKDTWCFAHQHLSRTWIIVGVIMLIVSVIPMVVVIGMDDDTIGSVSLVVMTVQIVLLIVSILPTERALKNTFDENGNRK